MYLSKLSLNRSNRCIMKAMKDREMMHKDILAAFDAPRHKYNVLFRVVDTPMSTYVYVQSDIAPNWGIVTSKGYLLENMQRMDEIEDVLTNGTYLTFTCVVNPRKQVAKSKQKMFIQTPQEREQWFNRKAEQYGFETIQIREKQEGYFKNVNKKTGDFILRMHEFTGILKITDKEKFMKMYKTGFGAGKAYGCGMMMLQACRQKYLLETKKCGG